MKSKKGDPCPRNCIKREPIRQAVKEHTRQIKEITARTERVEKGVDFILNKVSANGHPGLENSLKDIHSEVKSIACSVKAVLEATRTSRAWTDVRKSISILAKASLIGTVLTNKFGRIVAIVAIVLFLNSILHAIGVDLDVQSLLRFLRIILS